MTRATRLKPVEVQGNKSQPGGYPSMTDLAVRMTYRGAWAANTAYNANDIVTIGGETLVCKTTHLSAAGFSLTNWDLLSSGPHVFNVKLYGARGDGTTDDTPAVNSTVTAAYNYAVSSGTFYAEVYVPPALYKLSSPTIKSTTNKGNSQIPLPLVDQAAHKVTLVFRGVRDGAANPHWAQTTPQHAGSVLSSTLTGQAYDSTWGLPSIIGGPTPDQGYAGGVALYNNLLVVVDGITLQAPANPSLSGMDLRGIAQASIVNLGCQANQAPGSGVPAPPTNSFNYGLMMPLNGNNDYQDIGRYACEGWWAGIGAGEHTNARSLAIVYCTKGIRVFGTNPHGIQINYASVEWCLTAMDYQNVPSQYPSTSTPINIAQLDIEHGTGAWANPVDIDDPSNNLSGTVTLHNGNQAGLLTINGGNKLRIIDMGRLPGAVAAPAVPASTVAYRNTFYRDAAVVINGGTVTGVAINGVTQPGITSGLVIVPSGQTITLTYSVAPTWTWTLS